MALKRRAAAGLQAGRAAAIDLRRFSRRHLERMAGAGREVAECESVLAKTGDTVVGELLRHQPFFEWDHYPAGEVFDPETQALYYYHAHPSEQRDPEEHGHFHTFIRAIDLPQEIRPLPLPTCDAARCTCHYKHHKDRRAGPRRRGDWGGPMVAQYTGSERRRTSGRRADDKN